MRVQSKLPWATLYRLVYSSSTVKSGLLSFVQMPDGCLAYNADSFDASADEKLRYDSWLWAECISCSAGKSNECGFGYEIDSSFDSNNGALQQLCVVWLFVELKKNPYLKKKDVSVTKVFSRPAFASFLSFLPGFLLSLCYSDFSSVACLCVGTNNFPPFTEFWVKH